MEKIVVKSCLYPILDNPTCSHLFRDQYAFRPTGSTTCALINLTRQLTKLLQEYPYVHLLALDFSKAFDTVRHSTLLEKSAKLPIQDFAHNWLLDFLEDRQHCTKFNGKTSVFLLINASIVQGSGIGPFAYVINASDLRVLHDLDELNKYADDSYLIVPSVNFHLVAEELEHISVWAKQNNLTLNVSKTKEMIVRRPRTKLKNPPPCLPGVTRVESMNILGVIFQDDLKCTEQVDRLVARGAQTLFAIRTLRNHGLSGQRLWEVTQSTFLSRLTYASQAWYGMLDANGKARLESTLQKAIKQGFLPQNHKTFAETCYVADKRLFRDVLMNPHHVLHHLLPPVKSEYHSKLRPRAHNREIPNDVHDYMFTRNNFITRMLKTYKQL